MDVRSVRSRFQKKVDFFVSSNYTNKKIHLRYSLQQDTTTANNIQLFITSKTNPDLEGRYIEVEGQKYLVYKRLIEPQSKHQWAYDLLFMSEFIHLREIIASKNAIGGSVVMTTDGNKDKLDGDDLHIIDGIFPVHVKDSLATDTSQVVDTTRLIFLIPTRLPIKLNKSYIVYYQGLRYKQKTLGVTSGATVLQVTREQ